MSKLTKTINWVALVIAVLAILGLITESNPDTNTTAGLAIGFFWAFQSAMNLFPED